MERNREKVVEQNTSQVPSNQEQFEEADNDRRSHHVQMCQEEETESSWLSVSSWLSIQAVWSRCSNFSDSSRRARSSRRPWGSGRTNRAGKPIRAWWAIRTRRFSNDTVCSTSACFSGSSNSAWRARRSCRSAQAGGSGQSRGSSLSNFSWVALWAWWSCRSRRSVVAGLAIVHGRVVSFTRHRISSWRPRQARSAVFAITSWCTTRAGGSRC